MDKRLLYFYVFLYTGVCRLLFNMAQKWPINHEDDSVKSNFLSMSSHQMNNGWARDQRFEDNKTSPSKTFLLNFGLFHRKTVDNCMFPMKINTIVCLCVGWLVTKKKSHFRLNRHFLVRQFGETLHNVMCAGNSLRNKQKCVLRKNDKKAYCGPLTF